jgi:hypothetical protein
MGSKVNADLIIVGPHGRTGMEHMVVSSTAVRVVRWSNTLFSLFVVKTASTLEIFSNKKAKLQASPFCCQEIKLF